jgi:Tfp pilus assembly protein PilW
VLDLYDHYAWRFLLREHPEVFGKPLQPDDTWQERYISGPEEKSPELRFWLSAATGTDTPTSGALPQGSTPGQPTRKEQAGTKKSSKTKTARKKTRTKTLGKKTAEQAPPKKKTVALAKRKVPAKKKAATRQKAAKQKVATSQRGVKRKVATKRVSAKKVARASATGKKTTKRGVQRKVAKKSVSAKKVARTHAAGKKATKKK